MSDFLSKVLFIVMLFLLYILYINLFQECGLELLYILSVMTFALKEVKPLCNLLYLKYIFTLF